MSLSLLLGCDLLRPETFSLTIEKEGEGTVNPSPGNYTYKEVTVVDLKALPDEGWRFLIWEGDAAEPNKASTTVSVHGDQYVKAFFEEIPKPEYTLTITIKREGEVGNSTTSPAPGTHTFQEDTLVQLKALPSTGSSFSHWEGDLRGIELENELVMGEDMEITGVFSFFAGGVGGETDPYLIKTPGQLYNVRKHITGEERTFFKQVADIDLSNYSSQEGWKPIGLKDDGTIIPFKGFMDGNGYAITNLFIHRPENSGVGLFAQLSQEGNLHAMILNHVQEIKGGSNVGALVGISGGVISNSYACGTIEAVNGGYSGNLVGRNEGTITGSNTDGEVFGVWDTGGLVGFNRGSIENSFSLSTVNGTGSNIGGLVGRNEGIIRYAYGAGTVEGERRTVGGLVGANVGGEIEGSYYDRETTNQSDTGKGEPKRTEEMKTQATFVDWDFQLIWSIEEGETYPYQKWMGY